MTPAHRGEIVRGLVEVTRLRRRGAISASEYDDWTAPDGTELIVSWDDQCEAFGAEWTCGRVLAGDVARLLGAAPA